MSLLPLALLACATPLPTDGWLVPTEAGPACAAQEAVVDAELSIRLLVGPDVDVDEARRQSGLLAATWAAWGLRLRLAGPPERTPERTLLAGDPASLLRIDEPDPPARDRAVLTALSGPARRLIQRPARDEVVVALLPHLMTADSPARRYFTELRGLTLRPGAAPWTTVLGEAPFTPLVAVAVNEPPPPGQLDLTLSHELGHALGMEHATAGPDLMQPGWHRCVPGLGPEARAALHRRFP